MNKYVWVGYVSRDTSPIIGQRTWLCRASDYVAQRKWLCYQEDEIVKPLCIILPQMNGYIKYFKSGGKNMSFFIKNDEVCKKYEEIWDVIKNKLGIKFHSEPIYEKNT